MILNPGKLYLLLKTINNKLIEDNAILLINTKEILIDSKKVFVCNFISKDATITQIFDPKNIKKYLKEL